MGAIFIQEMTIIFDVISVFGNSATMMVIPGLFVILTQDYFPKGRKQLASFEGKTLRVLAYTLILIGILNFILGMYAIVMRISAWSSDFIGI